MVIYAVEYMHTGEWEGLDSGKWFGEIVSFYASFHAAWEVARSHKLHGDNYTVAVVMYVKNGNNSFDRQSIHYVNG